MGETTKTGLPEWLDDKTLDGVIDAVFAESTGAISCHALADVLHTTVRQPALNAMEAKVAQLSAERDALMCILLQQRSRSTMEQMRDQLSREVAILAEAIAAKSAGAAA